MAMRALPRVGIGFLEGFLLLAAPVTFAATGAPPASGPEVGVRLGVALPAGDIQNGTTLSSRTSTTVPLVIEGGYRLDPALFLGARFQYAFADVKNPNGSCSGNTSCGGSVTALGLEATYRFLADRSFAPWLGLGFGYEWAAADYSAPNAGAGGTYKGFQTLAQAGGDVRLGNQLVLGPFLEASFGRYDTNDGYVRLGNVTSSASMDIADTAWHAWIAFGVRGAFGF